MKPKTRFAPSPTGALHIGGLRTALYAYALAKHEDGEFVLRIEDTDKKREIPGSREKIKEILKDYGLIWDEYFEQSKRVEQGIYKIAAEKLVGDGFAFYCQCEAKNAKEGFSSELRDPCRDKGHTTGAIKLKVPTNETISFHDFVLDKDVSWDTNTVGDATLLKSDGYPTYHLAVVVDDTDMGISHVLRGHDWMPSTPIHLLVYKYLNLPVIQIGHLTDILDPEGGKLSKRKGSTSVEGLEKDGYLRDALFNFVILLGWAPKNNQEMFTLEEFVKEFDINGFQKSNPVFNREKLDWFNGYYIRQKSDSELAQLLKQFAPENASGEVLLKVSSLIKDRIKKLSEFASFAGFFFEEPEVDKSLFGTKYNEHLNTALEVLENIAEADWELELLNEKLMEKIKEKEFKTGDFFMDLRIAITGKKFTPPINDSIIILGKDESTKRLKKALE